MRVGDVLGPEFRADLRPRPRPVTRRRSAVWDYVLRYRGTGDASGSMRSSISRSSALIDSEYEINRLPRRRASPSWPKGPRVRCWTSISAPILSSPPPIRSVPVPARVSASLLRVSARCSASSRLIVRAWAAGPFPTELFDETGAASARHLGHEYGAVTGRERRCGWLDMVALKYAIMIDGVTQLIMMKSRRDERFRHDPVWPRPTRSAVSVRTVSLMQ